MRKRKGLLPLLLLGGISFTGLLFYIFFISPEESLSIGAFMFSPIFLFFILLLSTLACLSSFILINLRQGILLGTFLSSLLLLRLFGFTSYLYVGLLIIIVLLVELGFRKQ